MNPDVSAKSFDILQQSADAGDSVSILFSWENTTEELLDDIKVNFYLSSNYWISNNDYLLGSYTIESLASDSETELIDISFDLPEEDADIWKSLGNGAYYIGMIREGETEAYPVEKGINQDLLKVSVPGLADLTGKSFDLAYIDPHRFEFSFNIANIAQEASGSFRVDFYLSGNEHISSDDFYLGSYDIEELAARSETGEIVIGFDLPSDDESFWVENGNGIYHAGMIINPEGTANETKLANNSNQGEMQDLRLVKFEKPAVPNLQTLSFDVVEDRSFEPNQELEAQFAIANSAYIPIRDDFEVSFYLSADATISTEDTLLDSVTIPGGTLDAQDWLKDNIFLTLPDGDADIWAENSDRYFVGMLLDSENSIIEQDESDNSNQEQLVDFDGEGQFLDNFRANIPDLVMFGMDVERHHAEVSGTVDINFSVGNVSQGTAEPFSVSFYLSDNDYISTNDVLLGTYEVTEGLEGGISSTEEFSQTFAIPDVDEEFWIYEGDGSYYVGAIIDAGNEVEEYYKSNNSNIGYKVDIDTVVIDDIAIADLVPSQFNVAGDWTVEAGTEVDLEFAVANHKTGDAGAFEVQFYLSNNDYISSNDLLVGSYQIDSLHGNDFTGTLETSITLPDAEDAFWDMPVFGTYYLGMVVDSDNEVREFTQLNNSNQGQYIDTDAIEVFGLMEDTEADLFGVNFDVVADADLDSPVMAGDNVSVKYEVANGGTAAVEYSATNFFLFTEEYLNDNSEINYDDIYDADSGLTYLSGDYTSNLIELEGDASTGELMVDLVLPSDLETGYYYLGMLNDQYDEVAESNEANNSLTGEFMDYEKIYVSEV